MMRSCLLASAVMWACCAAGAADICPRVETAPAMDGKVDDAAWAGAMKLTGFTVPKSDRAAGKAVRAWACFDAKCLYLAVACDEPTPAKMRTDHRLEDEHVWMDDCVEVWIRTTGSTLEFDQFIVNSIGTRESLRRRQRPGGGADWKPAWRVKAVVEKARWVAQFAIPWSDLELGEPRPGDMIQLKIGREDRTAGGDEEDVALSVWPAGAPYAGTEGFACVYLERDSLLANADMSAAPAGGAAGGGKIANWSFGKGDAGLFSSVDDGGRRVICFAAPGRYCTASQSLKLKPDARYRIEAKVKGTAGVDLRARTAAKAGATSTPYSATAAPSAEYRTVRVPFPTGPTGEALLIVGNTEGGGAGEAFIADLRVVQEASFDAFGPAIPIPAGAAAPTVIRKLAVADCRALRGFIGVPVDGTTRSRGWSADVWEYNQPTAGAGVGYSYHGNDGLHVTLGEGGGLDAIQILGGAAVKVYRDCPKYDDPAGGSLLADLPGRTQRSRMWFDKPVDAKRVSFFNLTDGRLADVSFFRVTANGNGDRHRIGGKNADSEPVPISIRLPVGGPGQAGEYLDEWLTDRFDPISRRVLTFGKGAEAAPGTTPIQFDAGRTVHLVGEPLAAETPLAAIGLDFTVTDAAAPVPITMGVQDPLNGRSQLFGADVVLSAPGRCRVVMDFPDQIVPAGTRLWLSVTFGSAATVRDAAVELCTVPRQRALPEALAYREFLLKTYFCCLSEARPWNGWYTDELKAKSLADKRYGPPLKELQATLAQCKALGGDDDLVRQYDEWFWRTYRRHDKTVAKFTPRIDAVAGAPEWAVVARQAWLSARQVPKWWLDNRLVPSGELGGEVGDDSDQYGNYEDFPMFESDGVGGAIKAAAANMAELAEKENLTAGLNRRSMDPLHAYEEGMNHESIMAWWNYGDPVYLERCIVAARSTEALTVVTPAGHRHFKNQDCGAADLRMDRKLGVDGGAHPLMWHPTFEVAWYNANPRAIRHLREWADGWLAHMPATTQPIAQATTQPGTYPTAVDVAAEKVVETTNRPLYGGYGGQGSAFLFLYWITGEEKYLGPFMDAFRRGLRNTSPALILPELIHRNGLAALGGPREKLRELVHGEGAAETLVTGDKGPLIDALKADIAEMQRFPHMYTSAEVFTDRVFLGAISNATIAYTGGYSTRNKYNHTHALSWEGFGTDYAAWVMKASRGVVKVLIYNFADKPLIGRMRVWTLDHGRYRLTAGPDTDGDDRMDAPAAARQEECELLRGSAVTLTLPPRQVTVVELQQLAKLDDERLRGDLALSPLEVRVEGGQVHCVAHNIGSRDVASFEAALVDEKGTVRQRKTLGPLKAPLELEPQRLDFALPAPPTGAKGWSVVLDGDGKIEEIHKGNNRVAVP
jgi:hypothetical protein